MAAGSSVSIYARIRRSDQAAGYAFVTPANLLLLGLVLYPFLYGIYVSLFKTNLINKWKFVGAANYIEAVSSPEFWQSLGVTAAFTVGVVAGHFLLGFAFAHLLNLEIRGRTAFRAILLLPWLLPEVVAANIFKWILHPANGILNGWLRALGVIEEPLSWLGNPSYALPTLIVVCIWKGYPLVMLMILAGLQTVPKELSEAAVMDGASGWQVFRNVTIPSLKATLVVALVLDTLWWFKHVTIIWLLTQGGPGTSTTTVALSIYKQAFEYFDFGPASALAVIVFAICLAINFIYKKGLNDERG